MNADRDASLKLLEPPPDSRLQGWLSELYGKEVSISARELLRHRDLSHVERLHLADAVPATLIYKVVLPPWDVEQDLHEHILIPSVSHSARLYLTGQYKGMTGLFLEDLGTRSLLSEPVSEPVSTKVGTELAKLHRAFTYRIDEVRSVNVLKVRLPSDYPTLTQGLCLRLLDWTLISRPDAHELSRLSELLAAGLEGEPVSLVHGDMYAENVLLDADHMRVYFIDWSWFTFIGSAILDLATLCMPHPKNGAFYAERATVIDAYCQEYSRSAEEIERRLPLAEALARLLFLEWLVERRERGIMGTTVGHVDDLIGSVVAELKRKAASLPA